MWYEKTGLTVYTSHLDMNRCFTRAVRRADIPLWYTEGFNPHPYISIALPLQLGCGSLCELLDIQLEDGDVLGTIPERLNPWLPEGVRALSAAEPVQKVGRLKWVRCEVELVYDDAKAASRLEALQTFFARPSLVITKKTKRGLGELDLAPHIREAALTEAGETVLRLEAVVSAVEPTVNPSNLTDAISRNAPELSPDFARYRRLEVFDEKMQIFR
jgi:radical SAM-linked protein